MGQTGRTATACVRLPQGSWQVRECVPSHDVGPAWVGLRECPSLPRLRGGNCHWDRTSTPRAALRDGEPSNVRPLLRDRCGRDASEHVAPGPAKASLSSSVSLIALTASVGRMASALA